MSSVRRSVCFHELLHLTALNAFGIVQPILDRLAGNAGFLQRYGYSGAAVLASIVVLSTTIPVTVFGLVTLLRYYGREKYANRVMVFAIGALSIVSLLMVARWLSASLNLLSRGMPDLVMAIGAICAGLAAVRLYFRSVAYRQILSLCAVGVILFPLNFFNSAAIRQQVLGISNRRESSAVSAKHPAPVIMIVFDGLCGMALLNEQYEIDRIRYPAFARLGDMSSFYRNATTVHPRTTHAVPAILASSLPEEDRQPLEAEHPTNLFRLIHDSGQYDMSVFEPFTHFYPEESRRITSRLSVAQQTGRLLETLLRVFAQLSIPQDLEFLHLPVPLEWFGLKTSEQQSREVRDGRISYIWDTHRSLQFEHFVDCLEPTSRPGFRFLHIVVPHDPWNLLPSGKSYHRYGKYTTPIYGSYDEDWTSDELPVSLAWQRYLLQLQFTDLWLGRILDQLQATNQLDESLIVVTSDHGMAFVPGVSRRVPSAQSLSDIISVPLFLKLPGQQTAEVSDRNVETIDILPTIADVLGFPADGAWEGSSFLSAAPERPRKRVLGLDTIINPDFPQRFRSVDRMIQIFGSGTKNDRLWQLNTIPDLIGVELSQLTLERPAAYYCGLLSEGTRPDPTYPNFVPCYFHGVLVNAPAQDAPRQLAVSLNGVIRATTRTSTDNAIRNEWSALLPDSEYLPSDNRIQLFELENRDGQYVLHEIQLRKETRGHSR
jgi:hypothetical protein